MKEILPAGTLVLSFNALRKILYGGVFLSIIVVGIHDLAGELSWYWIFKWFDTPMHVLGGATASYFAIFALLTYIFIKHRRAEYTPSLATFFITGLVGALFVGILWEFLEFAFGLSGLGLEYRFDTFKDLMNDMIGGVLTSIALYIGLLDRRNSSAADNKSNSYPQVPNINK